MKQEYKNYGLIIGVIGEKIGAISNEIRKINLMEGNTVEVLRHRRDSYDSCLNEYRACKAQLLEMSVPNVIKKEHSEFVDAFDQFIEGTSKAFNAIDLESISTNDLLVKEGLSQQKKGEALAVSIIENITTKLLQN